MHIGGTDNWAINSKINYLYDHNKNKYKKIM